MPKILTPEELGRLNDFMLCRGAPIEKDGAGYNQPDYALCKKIFNTPNKEQCNIIAKTLIKYCNTQLKGTVTSEDMRVTATHYARYTPGKYIRPIEHDEVGVWTAWAYNPEINSVIKQVGYSVWDAYKFEKRSEKGVITWMCRLGFHIIDKMLEALEKYGVEVCDVKEYLSKLPPEVKSTQKPNKPIAQNGIIKIQVKREGTDRLSLRFEKNDNIRLIIKSLPQWKFVKTTDSKKDPHWLIDLDDAEALYILLRDNLKNLDLSELKYWADLMACNSDYKLKDFSHLKRKPRPSQIEGANALITNKRMICGDEMGVGKTFQCIMVGESLPMPKLVICPASLRLNWEREIRMVNSDADIQIIYNNMEFKMGKDWTIIGYPSLSAHKDMIEECEFKVLFVDEAHFCKAINNSGTPDSQRAEIVQYIAKTAEYCVPITGTPKPNRNKDLFNLLRMIKHPLAKDWSSWFKYAHTFCGATHNGFGWDFNGNSHDDELHTELKPYMIRRLKKEVLPNIKKIRSFIPVQVDLNEYHKIIHEYMREYHERKGTIAEHLARISRARMVLSISKAQATIDFVKDFLEEDKKIVIMTNYTEVVNRCKKAFGNRAVTVVGGMSDEAKQASIDRFQTGDAEICKCNLIAGGVGITLTAAYNMICNDFDYVPGNHIQAEDRIARSGQTQEYSNIFYMYAVGADIDEMFAEILQYKFDTINTTIDGGYAEDIDIPKLIMAMLEEKIQNAYKTKVERISITPSKESSKTKSGGKSNGVKQDKIDVNTKVDLQKPTVPSDKEIKQMANEEVYTWARAIGAEWKICSHEPINRMRAVMAAKKILNIGG